jgi:hypothetical protein
MIDINKEAEEYASYKNDNIPIEFGNEKFNESIKKHFIAGHNSKATQTKVLQGQIDLILHFRDTFQFSMASFIWKNKLIELQQQLKQLEDEQ